MWVKAHSKETLLKRLLEKEIALVELNGLNEVTSSQKLERKQSGNTNLQDALSTPKQMDSKR